MNIIGADFKNGTLMLRLTNYTEGLRFARLFKPGEYEISSAVKKRSVNANNYAWELISKLSKAMQIDKDAIYCAAVRSVGAFNVLEMAPEAFDDFKRVWEKQGMAWFADHYDVHDGKIVVHAYYGSSSYDTRQMSQFIDYLKQDCESIGIETDDGRIASLLDEWERQHG